MEPAITPFDFQRMFFGEHPWGFAFEVAFRTVFMFVYTVVLIRLLGKRSMRQLAPYEIVIIIALGSAVGDPMFYADVPLFHAALVVTLVVLMVQLISFASERSERFERVVESEPRLMVRDGVINVDALDSERLAHDELLATLREAGYENLGDVRLAYLESSGRLSVFRADDGPDSGLSLLPSEPRVDQPAEGGQLACRRCGRLIAAARDGALPSCPKCGENGKLIPASRRRPNQPS